MGKDIGYIMGVGKVTCFRVPAGSEYNPPYVNQQFSLHLKKLEAPDQTCELEIVFYSGKCKVGG